MITPSLKKIVLLSGFLAAVIPFALAQPSGYPQDVLDRIKKVESGLAGNIRIEGSSTWTLQERMDFHGVPGVTVGVVSAFKLEWAKGYGMADKEKAIPVTPATLFQAASISKSLNAVGLLRLVQDGKIDLNKDINTYLKTWKFPYDTVAKGKTISLYNLLTHTAGLTVHGFPGYEVGTPLPTVPQILDGQKPANTAAVRSQFAPGIRVQYSGGGTTISQQMVTDVQNQPYDQYMRDHVLSKLGMNESFYTVPPPVAKQNLLATAYGFDGKAKKGKYHLYPEQAAAALWTNPTDLSKYIIETQLAYAGKSAKVLNQETTKLRLTPFPGSGAALGVFIDQKENVTYFEHGGSNDGFQCQYIGTLDGKGNGVVVMVNSDNREIIQEIINSVSVVYNWSGYYTPQVRKVVSVPDNILADYVGQYELSPEFKLAISKHGDKLKVEPTGQGVYDLYAESNTSFFLVVVDAKIEFVRGANGGIEKLILHQNGRDMEGKRLP